MLLLLYIAGLKRSLVSTKSLLLLYSGIKAVFSRYKVVPKTEKQETTKYTWNAGNGDPIHKVVYILHRIPRAWKDQEEEADTRIIEKE